MASGDVFSETDGSILAGTLVAIRPAAGVQVIITSAFSSHSTVQFYGGSTVVSYFPAAGGSTLSWNHLASGNELKLLLTNAEYINLYNAGANATYGYTGMEI